MQIASQGDKAEVQASIGNPPHVVAGRWYEVQGLDKDGDLKIEFEKGMVSGLSEQTLINVFDDCRADPEVLKKARATLAEIDATKLDTLRRLTASLLEPQPALKVGDVCEWKPGLSNRQFVGPFMVTEVLEFPLRDESLKADSCYWNEPLDVRLSVLTGEGNRPLVEIYADSRRFRLKP
jgi:hypothetical protein